MPIVRFCSLAFLLCVVARAAPESRPTFAFEQHLLVPVRAHLLRAKDAPHADCRLTPADLERIFGKAQRIWQAAGIQLFLESILEEEVDDTDFARSLTLDTPLSAYRRLRPLATRLAPMFHVYYIHRFSVNGVYMDRASIFVQDTARLRPVEGGIDEPIPRVTAHELGHGFGLSHRQDLTNLMASGTSGTSLNAEEIELARKTLTTLDWVQTPEQMARTADEAWTANRRAQARILYAHLSQVLGDSALKQRALERLKEP